MNEEVIRQPKHKDGTKVLGMNPSRTCGFDLCADPAANRAEQAGAIIEARAFVEESDDFEK